MTSNDDLDAALRVLRADYLADAPRRVAELWTAWARVQNGQADALEQLRTLVHRLAGTGTSYGVPQVTERSRAADQACRAVLAAGAPPTPDEVRHLRQLLQGIADAFHDASTLE